MYFVIASLSRPVCSLPDFKYSLISFLWFTSLGKNELRMEREEEAEAMPAGDQRQRTIVDVPLPAKPTDCFADFTF